MTSTMKRTAKSQRFVEAVGQSVRDTRKAKGLGQDELGKRIGADAPTVSRIESGKKDIRLSQLWELGRALETSPAEIVSVEVK